MNKSIKQIIQELAAQAVKITVMTGAVVSESPLEIVPDEEKRLILSEDVLTIPEHLRDYATESTSGSITFSHTINAHLKAGDRVLMLAVNDNNQYIVLGRE